MYKHSSCFILAFLYLCFSLIGQNEPSGLEQQGPRWSIYTKYGIPLFENSKEPTFSSFETSFELNHGVHAILGFAYRFYLKNKISIDVEAAYQYGSFSRTEKSSFIGANEAFRESVFKRRYQTRSILYPIKLNYDLEKWSFSSGIVLSWHTFTTVEEEKFFFVDGELAQSIFATYKDGDFLSTAPPFVDTKSIKLEKRINAQIMLGLQYSLLKRIILDFEIRQNLLKNRLQKIITQYDVGGEQVEYFQPFPRIVCFGVHYILK